MAELRDLVISPRVVLPQALLSVRFSRSGGPGGQHVNKVESKVDLRIDLTAAVEVIGEDRVARIRAAFGNRLDGDGQLQVVSSEHRQQGMNLEAALARLEAMIREALTPRKTRRKTRPTRGSQQRRLTAKRQRGSIKKTRGDRDFGD
jgi:ribosome-associated protein